MTDTLWCGDGSTTQMQQDTLTHVTAGGSEVIQVRKAFLINTHPSVGAWGLFSVGDVADEANWVTGWLYVPPAETLMVPLDVTLQNGETLRSRAINDMSYANGFRLNVFGSNLAGQSTTDGTAFTTGNWAAGGGTGYILSVVNTHASAAAIPSSIVDNHASPTTFVQLQSVLAPNGAMRLTQYRTLTPGSPGATNTVTINFGATQTGCLWTIDEITSMESGGTNGSRGAFAAGTLAVSSAGISTKVPATMPCGARYMTMAVQSITAPTAWSGWQAGVGGSNIITPSAHRATAMIIEPGDQNGYFAHGSEANRVAGLLCIQCNNNSFNRNLYARFSGVSVT